MEKTCLLIGNSRWHWAEKVGEDWNFVHTAPDLARYRCLETTLVAWASVGPIPSEIRFQQSHRLALEEVPLRNMPSWLGIDRALGAWGALNRLKKSGMKCSGLIVVDAGTILSLTRVMVDREFRGGQLVSGLRLQLASMDSGSESLTDPGLGALHDDFFPYGTSDAMRRGSLQALVGMLLEAQRQAAMPLWLCGGDSLILCEALRHRGIEVAHYPNLVLEGMVDVHQMISQGQDQ